MNFTPELGLEVLEKTKKTKKSLIGENITMAIKRLGYRSVEAFAEDKGLVLPTRRRHKSTLTFKYTRF